MKKASPARNLEVDNPILAKDWHPKKNGNLTPRDFVKSSRQKVWWKCAEGHDWQATVNNRYHGTGCQKCRCK
jgi:hypothetical protein